jgi:hypothetical protein
MFRVLASLWLSVSLVTGCASQLDSPSPRPEAAASPGRSPDGAPSPTPLITAPRTTFAPTPTGCIETPLTANNGLVSGSFADVMTTDLVQRTAPWIGEDSKILRELNAPTRVYVLEGPVGGGGYEWWHVISEGGNRDDAGWVAARGKDGEEWLRRTPDRGGTWSIVSRHDVTHAAPAVASSIVGQDGRLYLFGGVAYGGVAGTTETGPLKNSLAFDRQACAWLDLAPMPLAQEALHSVSAANGLLYVIGAPFGGSAANEERSDVQVYDPATDSWAQAKAAPARIAWGSAVISDANGLIWTFGGYKLNGQTLGIMAYDPAQDAWQGKPIPTAWPRMFFIDGAAHLGDGDVAVLASGGSGLWRYGLNDGAWSELGWQRVARYNASMVAMPDGRLAVSGGYLAGSCARPGEPPHAPAPSYDLVDVFDPDSGQWQALPPLPLELESLASVVIEDHLYIVGLERSTDMSRLDVVVARYDPPSVIGGKATTSAAGAGGCGG